MHSLATQKCPKPLCPRPFWLKDVHDASVFVGLVAGPLMLLMLIQAPWQARVAVYKISARGFSSTKKKSAQYKKPKRTGVQVQQWQAASGQDKRRPRMTGILSCMDCKNLEMSFEVCLFKGLSLGQGYEQHQGLCLLRGAPCHQIFQVHV